LQAPLPLLQDVAPHGAPVVQVVAQQFPPKHWPEVQSESSVQLPVPTWFSHWPLLQT
jgi:hypothetical protein